MALRANIPRALELARGRKFKYRARCAWGDNHLRRRGEDGELLRSVSARSTASGKTIDTAIDGYRPHEDPLDAAYLSHWESTGRPLRPQQFDSGLTSGWFSTLFGDDATDTNGTLLKNHTPTPTNNTNDIWHDPSDRFQIQSNAIQKNGVPDYTTYLDTGNDEYELHTRLYVDNAGTFDGGVLVRYRDNLNFIYVQLHSSSSGTVRIIQSVAGSQTNLAVDTTWTIGVAWFDLVISVRRNNLKVYVDGVQYLDFDTWRNSLETKIGLHCSSGCTPQWDNVHTLRPRQFAEDFVDWSNWSLDTWGDADAEAESVSTDWGKLTVANNKYSEDFEARAIGYSMVTAGWVNYNNSGVSQFFNVVTGKYGHVSSGTGPWTCYRDESVAALLTMTDCIYRFKVKSTASGRFIVVTHHTSGGGYVIQGVIGVANELTLRSCTANDFLTGMSNLDATDCPASVDEVVIQHIGNRIIITIDDVEMIDYTDASNLHPSGSFTVGSYLSGWEIDDIEYEPTSAAGYSALLDYPTIGKFPVLRDGVYQLQLGKNKPTHSGSLYSESGICISNSDSNDISAETDCLIVCIRSAGDQSPRLVFRKIVAGTVTDITYQALQTDEYSENIRVIISGTSVQVWTAKYGRQVSTTISNLDPMVHVKAYVATNEAVTVNGYFRDVALFPNRQIHIGEEVGVKDSFATVNEDAWALFGSTTLTADTIGDENVQLIENPGAWAWAAIPLQLGDFVWTGRARRLNSGSENFNLVFCIQEMTGISTTGYMVTFNSTAVYLGKDNNASAAGPATVLETNTAGATVTDDDFEWSIIKHGERIMVYKDGALVIDTTDASYESGAFAIGGNDASSLGVAAIYEHEIAPRGLQTPALLRIDRAMVQNPSFEEWDDLTGLTEDTGVSPNSWRSYNSTSGEWVRTEGTNSGEYAIQVEITDPELDAYFLHETWQKNIRFLEGHRYRVSFQYKWENTGGGLVGGFPFIYFKAMTSASNELVRHMIQLASPTENYIAEDEWFTADFDFVAGAYWANADQNYVTLQVSTEYPDEATFIPTGDFNVAFDQLMIEDLTGISEADQPELQWTETPTTYRGQEADREEMNDWSQAFYTMPLNVVWRIDDQFTWGLLDRDYVDLFTSRINLNVLPGALWLLSPEWIACDLGVNLNINQVLWYSLWSSGIRSLLLTHGSSNFSQHSHARIMDGLTVYSTAQRLFLEIEDEVTARFVQVVVLDTDEEGNIATAQQIELYNYSDESERVINQDGGSPEVSITMTRPSDRLNPLPDASGANVSLANNDRRFTPYNKNSQAYGPYKHADGLGDIRAGVPLLISVIAAEVITPTTALYGDNKYAVRDECFGDQYWESGGWLDNSLNPGFIRLTPPSSPPLPYQVFAKSVTLNVDVYNKVEIGIERANYSWEPTTTPNFKWRLGVAIGPNPASPTSTVYFPDSSWRTQTSWGPSYGPESGITYLSAPTVDTLDMSAAGITGEQTVTPFVEFEFVGGFPTAYEFYVMIDHYYIYQEQTEREIEYETLMFMGTIGVNKNKGGALGISLDGVSGTASIDAVDFTVTLDQPAPVSELNPLETITAEETMRKLCYLAGIPRQDTTFDATGIEFPVVVFREQTIRENIQQIIQAIGGRFYSSRDGRLRYQNVSVGRSWTLTDKQEFESGIKSNIDTQSKPGEFWMDNVQWEINHRFDDFMPDQQVYLPWSLNSADAWRFLSSGDYVVITPAGQGTKMQHVLLNDSYNKSEGFTLEYDVALIDKGGHFDIWGYVYGVAAYETADCAWRVRIRKYYGTVYVECGSQLQWWGAIQPLYNENVWAFPNSNDRLRVRITFSGDNYNIYLNDYLHKTVPLTTPKMIRWNAYESEAEYEDDFGAIGNLNGRSGDVNTTGDVWHDPNNRWRLDNYLHKNGTTEDWTTYLDFSCPEWWLTGSLYVDRSTAREAGWMLRYVDANNWVALRVVSNPDPNNGWQVILSFYIVARVGGGAVQTIAQLADQYNAYEGSQTIAISVTPFSASVYIKKYNPAWVVYTLWETVGGVSFYSYSQITDAMKASTKMAPYYNGGASNGCSWDGIEMGCGGCGLTFDGPPISYPLPGGGTVSSSSSWQLTTTTGKWYPPVADTYSAKTAIGLEPAAYAYMANPSTYPLWSSTIGNQTTGYRLGAFLQKFSGGVAPLNEGYNGVLTSPIKDLTANVAGWGIFEAEVTGIGKTYYKGLYDQVSNVDFYLQTSADGTTWSSWVKVVRGQLVPSEVPLQQYFRWQARFWRSYEPWVVIGYPLVQYSRMNYYKASVLSATINWQISTAVTAEWFRATWNVAADNEEDTEGVEMNSAQYSLGNPEANRVTALVNRWVEQDITVSSVQPFWESSELPTILDSGESYVINAQYAYPSKQGSGATLRHLAISVNGTPYTVNDGAGATVCGNATVTFTSGQGVGVITILATAAATTINSAMIDAVAYMSASELYGTERVMSEDEAAQGMQGRIIESDTFDNAFSMSRTIAQAYADAELVRTKQYKETIAGVQLPLMPSLSLENYGVVHNPAIGLNERQIEPMEIMHQGFVTIVTGQGVRTQEETIAPDPLPFSPTGAWATHRMTDCQSDYILKVRSELTGAEIDIYDFQYNFPLYQLEDGGDWLDATDEDFRVTTIYDQTGNDRDFVQTTAASQPYLQTYAFLQSVTDPRSRYKLAQNYNGWPVVEFDGTDDTMTTTGHPISELIAADEGEIIIKASITAIFPYGSYDDLLVDSGSLIGIRYTTSAAIGGTRSFVVFNNDGSEDTAGAAMYGNTTSVIGWKHEAGQISAYLNGVLAQSSASGNTSALTGTLTLGNSNRSEFSSMFSFDSVMTDEDRATLTGWMQSN